MDIWLVTTGEIIPFRDERPNRIGMLSRLLIKKGHNVTWWTTTFDHQSKKYIYNKNSEKKVSPNFLLIYMHSNIAYKKNISFRRALNHYFIAKQLKRLAIKRVQPELILCSFPTIELSLEIVKYGLKKNVPVIIDIRDLWPDIFVNLFPQFIHPIIRVLLTGYYNKTKYIFRNCTSIISVSQKYLSWGLSYRHKNKTTNDQVFPLGYEKSILTDPELTKHTEHYKAMGLDVSKVIVWFVGTFGKTYDLETIIKGATVLHIKNRYDIQFVFTGDGEMMTYWKKLALGLKNIIFTGWVNKIQLKYLSQVASIGLMAYNNNAPQGLPNKLFEYMAHSLPILSSLESETKDVILLHRIGLSYEANNIDSFISNLIKLADNKLLRKEMGQNAKCIFEKEYAADIVYNKLVNYLEDQVNHKNNVKINE